MSRFLLKTDISGIQNYIFDIPSKGAVRVLKTRSFYVYALTHLIERYLKREFEVEETIYNGGGNLLMVLRADEANLLKKTVELQHSFDKMDIYAHFAWTDYSINSFEESNVEINKALAKKKLCRQINTRQFTVSGTNHDEGDKTMVKNLIRAEGFKIIEDKSNDYISLAGLSISFTSSEKSFKNSILNKLPQDPDGGIIDFDAIAERTLARGADKKLAALKMDVDNLGKIFMNRSKDDYKTLSAGFETFFSQTIYEKILKKHISSGDVYPVFAGGDDCFFIGAWDILFEITGEIREAFVKAQAALGRSLKTKLTDDITISAGLVVVNANFPVIRMAEKAEEALMIAKEHGKNRITVFGQPLSWSEFLSAGEIASKLRDLIKNGESRALIQRVKSSDLGYRSLQSDAVRYGKINLPKVHRLKYYLRNIKKKENLQVAEKIFNDYSKSLLKDFISRSYSNNALKYPIAARWAELSTTNKND